MQTKLSRQFLQPTGCIDSSSTTAAHRFYVVAAHCFLTRICTTYMWQKRSTMTDPPRPLPPTGTALIARMIRDKELADWQKRLLELLVEAKRTNSRIVMAQGRHGPHWTLEPR